MKFRRRNKSDVWHWCRNCSNWPTQDFSRRVLKPTTGELCDECKSKVRNGNCRWRAEQGAKKPRLKAAKPAPQISE